MPVLERELAFFVRLHSRDKLEAVLQVPLIG